MDLWIKAQSGRLAKIDDIMQPIEDEFDNINGWVLYAVKQSGAVSVLGIYKSEERALKILSDIEEHIGFLNVEMGAGRFGELDFQADIVYTMPKE